MKSHPPSRPWPFLAACQRERRSARLVVAISLSASELRPEGCLIWPAREARAADHQSRITDFLIGSRQLLEIHLSSSQQTRKLFLTGGFSACLAQSLARHAFQLNKCDLACTPLHSRNGGPASAIPLGWQAGHHRAHLAITSVCACTEPLRN
jgi:hypothetical protein